LFYCGALMEHILKVLHLRVPLNRQTV